MALLSAPLRGVHISNPVFSFLAGESPCPARPPLCCGPMSALRDKTNLLPVDDLVREFRAEFSKAQPSVDAAAAAAALGHSAKAATTKPKSAWTIEEDTADGPGMAPASSRAGDDRSRRACLRESTRMASFASRRLARATEPTVDTNKEVGGEEERREEQQQQQRPWAGERMKKAVRVYSRKRISRAGSR